MHRKLVCQPIASVVMPCFNAAQYIGAALESIACQLDSSIEVILINDGSTDQTLEVIDKWSQGRPNVKVLDRINGGVADAFRAGIEECASPLIIRHDADDCMFPDRIAKQVQWMKNHPTVDAAGAWFYRVKDSTARGELVKMPTSSSAVKFFFNFSSQIANPTSIIRRQALDRVEFQNIPIAEDLDVWLQLISADHEVANMPFPVLNYRVHTSQATATSKHKAIKEATEEVYAHRLPLAGATANRQKLILVGQRWRAGTLLCSDLTEQLSIFKNDLVSVNSKENAPLAIAICRLYMHCSDFGAKNMGLLFSMLSDLGLVKYVPEVIFRFLHAMAFRRAG